MQHTLIFNKDNPIVLDNAKISDLEILVKEFDYFRHNFTDIINKLGNISLSYKGDDFSLNMNFNNTFKTHSDFVSACTILRPFLLQNEAYYAKANSIIRTSFQASKTNNILLNKTLDVLIPKQLANLYKYSKIKYKNKDIVSYFQQVKTKENSKVFNVMKKHLNNDLSITLNNYEFFDIYLYAFVFHRDKEFQRFIVNVIGIKDILNKDIEQPSTLFIVQNFYSICIQIMERIKNMDTLISYINRHIQIKDDLSISYFDESDSEFGIIKFNN